MRIFPLSSAIAFSLCAALAWTFAPSWMMPLTYVLTVAAAIFVAGWFAEVVTLLAAFISNTQNETYQNGIVSHDRDLILAEALRRMSGEQLVVYRDMVGMVHDPYDKDSVIIPGFSLLTKSFAVAFFASCADKPKLTPIRAYAEGRSDRQREQVTELTDYLVTNGYALRPYFNAESRWKTPQSAGEAMVRLGLVTE